MGNMYVGVSNTARKVKNIYIGISSKARKVSKGYVGVNNIARLFYSNGVTWIQGTASNLSTACYGSGTTVVGNNRYALIAGGYNSTLNPHYTAIVNAYHSSLVRYACPDLSQVRTSFGSVSTANRNFAIFGGGGLFTSTRTMYNVVDTYYITLTRGYATNLQQARYNIESANVGNYALLAGGEYDTKSGSSYKTYYSSVVDCFDNDLTKTTLYFGQSRYYHKGVTLGNYALFVGGYNSTDSFLTNGEYFDSALTRSTISNFYNTYRYNLAVTTVGNYALFGGGQGDTYYSDVVTCSTSLTLGSATNLSLAKFSLGATTVGNYALFGGGYERNGNSNAKSNTVETYDTLLTKGIAPNLPKGTAYPAAISIGNYALFCGGSDTDGFSNAVISYTYSS